MKILLLVISLLLTSTSYACECMNFKFNSLDDIEQYKFIGLVKIDSIYLLPNDTAGRRISHHASFSIIELYRGDSLSQMGVSGGNPTLNNRMWTSCDMGLVPGEEWIIFANEETDSTLQTSYCTFSRRYRSTNGQRDWHYGRGFDEIKKVKALLNIKEEVDSTLNGSYSEWYPDGSVEVEAQYENGLLNGKRIIRYNNGQIMTAEEFVKGLRNGPSSWFYENGTTKRKYKYLNDLPVDSCWNYHANGMIAGKTFYSQNGEQLYGASFSQKGQLTNTYEADTLKNVFTRTKYYDTGNLHYTTSNKIGEYANSNTTQYFEDGQIEGIWEYFDEGNFKSQVRRWNKKGELIFHKQTDWKGEITILKKYENRP